MGYSRLLRIFLSKEILEGGMIRIHSAFVHDKVRTMPSLTMKWLFSQFRAKLVSSHRLSIFSKWVRHVEKELPKTEKSSINTSIIFLIMSWKIAIIHLWNVPGALQRPKGMRR
ncbi:hypothetical protein Tco_0166601, partial [Tanacetum coccineum]